VVLLPGMAAVALPVGTTEVEGEGALRHEALGMLQPLDGLMPQQGQIEPLPVEVQDEIPTAMTVRLTLRSSFLFDRPSHAVLLFFFQSELWGAVSPPPPPPPPPPLPPSDMVPELGSARAQSSRSSSRAPPTAQRSVPVAGPSTSAPQIDCFCGKPSVEFTVRKESENKGRRFRRCGQPEACAFFEWADEFPQDDKVKRGGPSIPPSIPAKRSRPEDAVRPSDDQLYGLTHNRNNAFRLKKRGIVVVI